MKWINFGGGHHITRPDYDIETLIRSILFLKEKYGVEVYLEPGEAIALNTGYLVATVLDIVENGMPIAILDTSATCHMPDVLEMPYRPEIIGAGMPNENAYTYRFGGMTCLAGDVIGDYSFNEPLKPGDKLVLRDMAHYSMVKNNMFNGVNLPSIAVYNDEKELKSLNNLVMKTLTTDYLNDFTRISMTCKTKNRDGVHLRSIFSPCIEGFLFNDSIHRLFLKNKHIFLSLQQNKNCFLHRNREMMYLRWQKRILSMIQERQDKKIALAIDTSTNDVPSDLINNIVKLFETLKPDTTLVQADYKIRSIAPVKADTIKYYTHGKASYTLVLEWAAEEKIDTLFYITDVTGYIYEEMESVDFEMFWLVPDEFLPKVPFGRAIKIAS